MSSDNRDALTRLARRLGPLAEELVFVGGRIAELLATDPPGERIRPTDDSDCICRATTLSAYHRLGERLREAGFTGDVSPGAPICRWRCDAEPVDVMPVEGAVFGFRNSWFAHAVADTMPIELEPGLTIRIAAAPPFLAMKWEAFGDRGGSAWYGDADVEDIVHVVSGRPGIVDEVAAAPPELRAFVAAQTRRLLDAGVAEAVIGGALPDVWQLPGLIDAVRRRFEAIAAL